MQHLDNLEIPKDNFIEFTSKGLTIILASTILSWDGRNQNERAQLVIKRICHSIGICSSQASKRLSRRCEDLVRNIFSNFSHNAKRMHQFTQLQSFCVVKPHKAKYMVARQDGNHHVARPNPLLVVVVRGLVRRRLRPFLHLSFSLSYSSLLLFTSWSVRVVLKGWEAAFAFRLVSLLYFHYTNIQCSLQPSPSIFCPNC